MRIGEGRSEGKASPAGCVPLAAMVRIAIGPRPRDGAKSTRLGPFIGRVDGALCWIVHRSVVHIEEASEESIPEFLLSLEDDSASLSSRLFTLGRNFPIVWVHN